MNPGGRYLCSGVAWHGEAPALVLADPDGVRTDLPLRPGSRLGYRTLGPAGVRYCLGSYRVRDAETRTHVPCPRQAEAERGYQCGPCFAQDDLRFMHDFHRSGIAPEGLKRYLDEPHWLYVATFADGATKVGTASAKRKRGRLVEQGAVTASYVALADNGRVVRVLEDEVTRSVGLPQAVRSAAKAEALRRPLPPERLAGINTGFAESARRLLREGMELEGFTVVTEEFDPPPSWQEVLTAGGVQPYPGDLESGDHGFAVGPLLGSCALVSLDGAPLRFLADLSRLKGRRIAPGDYTTAVPAVQESLF
ncbi:DUF2797 domain-containing protein [uncultured Arthrobacter sp.]|uniref:DUF2797 domain-containing protein n=1 Tax=uncultured Arthrobacter sp. TaxID=114050 RepID=UPI0025D9B296|nr:DUF2797 domain-containing protein [uncultured Arthrobacter sp.]